MKISSEWDKRLLLSSRYKLKEYHTAKIFLREDLLLEVRKERARQHQVYRERSNSPPQDAVNVRSHESDLDENVHSRCSSQTA